jgi:drug/metabolite transporter (DMT)-like permease
LIRLKVPGQSLIMIRRLAEAAYANAYLLLTLVSLFWAGNQIVGRAAAGEIPPITLGCLRWLVATGLLLPFAWSSLKADWRVIRNNVWLLAFLGVIGGGAINTFSYIGLNYTTATNALILNSAAPIFIVMFCYLIYGDRITLRQSCGIAVSLVGVLIVVLHGNLGAFTHMTLNRGDVLVLIGMACWGLYTAFIRMRPAIAPLSFAACTFAAAAIVNIPMALIEASMGYFPRVSLASLGMVAYAGIFPSVFAYLLFNRGVELIGGSRAGIFNHLVPVFGAALAFTVCETPGLYHAAGFALILAGVWLAARA